MAGLSRDEYWDARLANWGIFITSDGDFSGRRIISSIYELYRGRYGGADNGGDGGVSMAIGEALDTHSLIKEFLSNIHFQAVFAWYAQQGTHESQARQLGIHVNTLRERVKAAKDNLERGNHERRRAMARLHAAPSGLLPIKK